MVHKNRATTYRCTTIDRLAVGKMLSYMPQIRNMGKEKALSEYYKKENCPIILAIGEDNSGMGLYTSGSFKHLKNELKNINSMLGLRMPSTKTIFRVIGDDKEGQEVRAIAVFVDKKPELYFQKKIEHRKSAEILYSGKEGSVYSDPEVLIQLNFIK